MITVVTPSEAQIRGLVQWRYPPPYEAYTIDGDPDEMVKYLLDPVVHCRLLVAEDAVIGFATFGSDGQVPGGEYGEGAIDIGLGIDPELIGRGRGGTYVRATVEYARETFSETPLRVTIAVENQRAITVWSRAGFVETSTFASTAEVVGSRDFVILQAG